MANAITGIGYSLRELNRVEEATKALDDAIDLLQESGHPFVVDTMRTKASWYSELKRWEDAIATYLEIIKINEIDGNSEFVARDLFAVAHCYHELGQWQQVIDYSLRAREIFKAEKMVYEISWCDLNIADSYAELGDGREALTWGQRANDVGVLRKDNEVICKSNYVMARGYLVLEDYDRAEGRLLQAQELVAPSNDWKQVTKIERALIQLYRATGKEEVAVEAERRLATLLEVME